MLMAMPNLNFERYSMLNIFFGGLMFRADELSRQR
jgi:hypothetical protein